MTEHIMLGGTAYDVYINTEKTVEEDNWFGKQSMRDYTAMYKAALRNPDSVGDQLSGLYKHGAER